MLFDKLKREKRHTYEVPKRDPGLDQPLSPTLEDTLARLAQLTGQTADLQVNRLEVEGYKLAFVMFEGLVNYQTLILGTAPALHALLPGQRYCAPPPGSRQAACAGRIYTARDGDTLAMIAERFGTTMRALLERNPNLTPNDFTNGQAFCV